MATMNLVFENANKFYFEGEMMRLKLEVHLQESATLNNVIANFVGVGICHINDDKENSLLKSKFYVKTPKEIYFDDVLPLFVNENKIETLPTGIQVFMFAYQLPLSIPTSVESAQGYIRYSICVYADINCETVKKVEHFTVVARTALHKNLFANSPGIIWKPENQCFLQALFCKASQIRAFVHIPKRGYLPGECLYINAEVSNFHRLPIEWVKASVIQILKYRTSNSFKEKRIMAEITRGCILPFDVQTWRSESVLIPAVPPTTYLSKWVICVKYKLLFQYKPSWLKKPVELEQKIIIGTAEIKDCEQQQSQQGEGECTCEHNHSITNLEPCIFAPCSTDEDDEKSNSFSPLYPMYTEI